MTKKGGVVSQKMLASMLFLSQWWCSDGGTEVQKERDLKEKNTNLRIYFYTDFFAEKTPIDLFDFTFFAFTIERKKKIFTR